MITVIIYINEKGIVDFNYKRILGFDIINNQINLLETSRKDFLEHKEWIFKEISDWTCTSREWKLILVDDSRSVCSPKAENCEVNGRNAYCGFEFYEQIRVLSGYTANTVYTTAPPQEFYLIRTRIDKQSYSRDVAYNGTLVRAVQGLPANIRYMVYDIQSRGVYYREESEWKLFFCLWLLARDEIIVDWMDVYKIYRIEIDWDVYRLSDYVEELRHQLIDFQNDLKSSEIPVRTKLEKPMANINYNINGGSEHPKEIHCGTGAAIKKESCDNLLKYLQKTKEAIEEQGNEAFREIRASAVSIGADFKDNNYESVLKEHYEKGNESFDDIEGEIRDLAKRQYDRAYARRSIVISLVQGLVITIVAKLVMMCVSSKKIDICNIIQENGKNFFFEILIALIVFTIVYTLCYFYTKREVDKSKLEMDYKELSQKVNDIINKNLNWINIQFDKMKLYKLWTNQKYIQKCEAEKDNLNRLQVLAYKSDIANALTFCNKLEVFSKKTQVKGWNGYPYLGLETERFYYPAGWMERRCACDVQGQSIRCPYYFLKHVMWRLEYGE